MNGEAKQHQYSIMGNDPETLDRELLLTLSKNNSYSLVLEKLLPKAMGAKKWKKELGYTVISQIEKTTISNEAFLLVVLANNWDSWMNPDLYRPKYTNGGNGNKRGGSTSKFSGWTNAGMCINYMIKMQTTSTDLTFLMN